MTLTARGWGCLAAAAVLAAAWFAIGLRDVWQFAAAFAALVVVAIGASCVIGALARARATLRMTDRTPTVGSALELSAVISHRLRVPVIATAEWSLDGARRLSPLELHPGSDARAATSWIADRRGDARLEVSALRYSDPFGLAAVRVPCAAHTVVRVLPAPLAALRKRLKAEPSQVSAPGDLDAAAVGRTGEGAEGGGALREYRTGDATRQINWKKSARQGELLVNLPEPASRRVRSVRLDLDPAAYASDAEFERAVSATATVLALWAEQGVAMHLELGDHLLDSAGGGQIDHTGSIDSPLRELAVVARAEVDAPAAEARSSRSTASAELPVVVVTGAPHRRLLEALPHSRGGTMIVMRDGSSSTGPVPLPPEWRILLVSEPA
ncbi:DUF58 domain-containing protein [Leucobacter musarum]|uniref:DUF58 domain-containing protein n=1 Tax=Leucobacter musarum TaxID=1930747 RepID=UPI0006A78EA3|nr:DUF58 domain-containing protein [Leucobacter musarum]